VISEVALACVLLVGAGLLLRSFLKVLDVDLGFEPSRSASIQVDYDDGNDAAKRTAIWQGIQGSVSAIPGVEAVGISDNLPMSRNRSWGIKAKGSNDKFQGIFVYIVSPGYLNAMGMRLQQGRDFAWNDGPKSEKVVILNETAARKMWPGQDPIGRYAEVNGDTRVVGVIADVRETSAEGNVGWQMYLPASQQGPDGAQLVVRSKLPPAALALSVMNTLRTMNPGQPATQLLPIQGLVDHAVSPRRFFVMLVSAFAGLGLVLASLGIYGVISYSVTRQTQEIGIRMALGASQGRVQRGVIWKTHKLTLAGIALGTVASYAGARLIATLLFGTKPSDPNTYAAMVVLLFLVATVAGYLPARRASRIDPMKALRSN
jgi:predicted permease